MAPTVSGTIGAVANNGLGVVGISQFVQIQPLPVLGKCGGYTSDIADAIRWSAGLSVSGVPDERRTPTVSSTSASAAPALRHHDAERDQRRGRGGDGRGRRGGNSNANASNFSPATART
jgi:serine protease